MKDTAHAIGVTYYVRHPDDSYSIAQPQPQAQPAGEPSAAKLVQALRRIAYESIAGEDATPLQELDACVDIAEEALAAYKTAQPVRTADEWRSITSELYGALQVAELILRAHGLRNHGDYRQIASALAEASVWYAENAPGAPQLAKDVRP